MAETTGSPRDTPRTTKKISGWLFTFLKFFWIAIVLAFVMGVLASVVAAVVPGNFSDLMKNITGWIFGNLLTVGLIAVILALFTYICYRGSRSTTTAAPVVPIAPDPPGVTVTNKPRIEIDNQPQITITNKPRVDINLPGYAQPSPGSQPIADESELERNYLQRMIDEMEKLKLAGIPADLFTMFAPNVPLDAVFYPHTVLPQTASERLPVHQR
jgi:hypothetical protein